MYLISNKERSDILKLLAELKDVFPTGGNTRKANMARMAGLLVRQLERKREINIGLFKSLKKMESKYDTS